MSRIAVAGFQHETNTFAPSPADYAAFVAGGGWPTLSVGKEVTIALGEANIPMVGAMRILLEEGHEVLPLVWAAASPSNRVTEDAFRRIMGLLLDSLREVWAVDAIYLDLHGAMVVDGYDDGEGEVLRRVREFLNTHSRTPIPLVVSLDLHANVTRQMRDLADGIVIYRTYPHVDMADTGARAAQLLCSILNRGTLPHKAAHSFDYLTGLPAQSTFIEPAQSLYALVDRLSDQHGVVLSFATGFPMADFAECGMSIVGYGDNPSALDKAMSSLRHAIEDAEADFVLNLYTPQEAIARAMRGTGTYVLADTQDNPGAGGDGDTTGLLSALIKMRSQEAVLGMLIDPLAADQAHTMGLGRQGEFVLGALNSASRTLSSGATPSPLGEALQRAHDLALSLPGMREMNPVLGQFVVEALGDGQFMGTGPFFRGVRFRLGKMACLRSVEAPGVRVVIASEKCQAADQAMFRHVGVDPPQQRIVAVKSSVHFRADFQPIAKEILVVQSPGPALADPTGFPWKNLRPGLRLSPKGTAFRGV